jgi:hypothetical protein
MKQDEIIEMARQASFRYTGNFSVDKGESLSCFQADLEAFAKLVAEKVNADWSETNERLIKVFNEKADLAYLSGAKEEREACAKVCEELVIEVVGNSALAVDQCTRAIRARGQA